MARRLPIGAKVGKVWGWTRPVLQTETTEVQHLRVRKGAFCSDHEHAHKCNVFYVLRGRLKVVVEKDGLVDETVLKAGEMTEVRPGCKHRFEALTRCDLIELYWVTLDPDDIRRHSAGGAARGPTPGGRPRDGASAEEAGGR